MPIRFRCAYCNQLLGIARRKSGTVVNCPKCAGQVVVPRAEAEPHAPSPGAVFEGNDFDKVLEGAGGDQPSVIATVGAVHYPVAASVAGDSRPPGIWLSPSRATFLSVLAVVLIAVAFGAGLLVGMFIQSLRKP
jgi:hypothetical protein